MLLIPFLFASTAAAWPLSFKRATTKDVSVPVDYTFEVKVPTSSSSGSPYVLIPGPYQVQIPQFANSGSLISWLGNYVNGSAFNTQLTALDPRASRNITTNSTTNSQEGGNSFTNATALADGQNSRVITTSHSSGNASSAAAGALDGTTSTSTSSSGASNSTAVATANALGDVVIYTSANTANALNSQSLMNARGSEAATSCAADNGAAASAEAEQTETLLIPIGTTPNGSLQFLKSSSYAACSAGADAPSQGGSSSSGSQASLLGTRSSATCNGATSTQQDSSTTFRVSVKGRYSVLRGFSGAVGGQRVTSSKAQC